MAACRPPTSFVALLLLVFVCQTLAAVAMYCQRHESSAMATMNHGHGMHHTQEQAGTPIADTTKADCCIIKGQCHLACSLALASTSLPLAIKISSPVADNYPGRAPVGVFSSVYKPPISA